MGVTGDHFPFTTPWCRRPSDACPRRLQAVERHEHGRQRLYAAVRGGPWPRDTEQHWLAEARPARTPRVQAGRPRPIGPVRPSGWRGGLGTRRVLREVEEPPAGETGVGVRLRLESLVGDPPELPVDDSLRRLPLERLGRVVPLLCPGALPVDTLRLPSDQSPRQMFRRSMSRMVEGLSRVSRACAGGRGGGTCSAVSVRAMPTRPCPSAAIWKMRRTAAASSGATCRST